MAVQYRAEKYLDEIMKTGIGTDNNFCEENLREVYKATRAMCNDLYKVYSRKTQSVPPARKDTGLSVSFCRATL